MRTGPKSSSRRRAPVSKTRAQRCTRLTIMVLAALSILNLQEARAASESDKIVAVDLLTVVEPRSQAESRLRVIRLTTRSGATGHWLWGLS